MFIVFFFFFSSRRRHTRWPRDWSSDVCSSDLLCLLATVAALALTAPTRADDPVPLKKGEKIVFLGDSITQAGVGPKGYVTLVKQALAERHKDLGVEVIGAGISGNKVP